MLVRSGPDKLLISLPRPGSIGSAGCSVLFAVELKFPHYGLRGFDAAMTRTRSLECRGKNCAVAEARPGRDDVSLRKAANGLQRRRSGSVHDRRGRPAEPLSGRPHAVQYHGKLAGNRHGRLLGADTPCQGAAPRLQIARLGRPRLKMTPWRAGHRRRSPAGLSPSARDRAQLASWPASRPMRVVCGACFLNASAIVSGVVVTLPRHMILSASSMTAIDVLQ